MKTQICLVSAQAAANLLSALDPDLKPQKVVLVVSPKMKTQANNLRSVLREGGLQVALQELADEHDFSKIENDLLQLAGSLEQDEVSLNITGGTKLMSVAAQSIANLHEWRMFYVDADTDQVIWLGRDKTPPHPLKEYLRLPHYLKAYGFDLPEPSKVPSLTQVQQNLIQTLIKQISSMESALAKLNWLAQQAEDKHQLDIVMDKSQQDDRNLEPLLRNFNDAGMLRIENNRIHFASEEARDFVKGGWLENHVFQAVTSLTQNLGIRDKSINLQIEDAQKVRNEQDVVFLARNRLFIIECKTARMSNPKTPKANDTLFKLSENCRRIGGLGTRGLLVSYRKLREPELRLAKALNIEVVTGADITRLPEKLKHWVRFGT
ncbi:MAG: DUF1887 family CARF protein [Betaproteobacteria bacterium]|nr:DUF1887 family CARF protein [Betaproteobacteria bacterium]